MTPADGVVRRASADDAGSILALGSAADRMFAAHGYPQIPALPPTPLSAIRDMIAGNDAWAALSDGRIVGFALAGPVAGQYWLKEIAVDPEKGQRGIGSALLSTVLDRARATGCPAIFLSTFRDVPFNAPFYARRGFSEVARESAAPELVRQFLAEVPPGVEASARILMRRGL